MQLTVARLRELLAYEPLTGVFTRKVRSAQRVQVGDVAGGLDDKGYIRIRVDGKKYRAHRLAWLWMTGEWPNPDCDHRNLVKMDNRWANLREATRSQNAGNLPSNNPTGLKGIYWHSRGQKWRSAICVHGRKKYIGDFDCKAAAHLAYVVAADRHFGEFSRFGG